MLGQPTILVVPFSFHFHLNGAQRSQLDLLTNWQRRMGGSIGVGLVAYWQQTWADAALPCGVCLFEYRGWQFGYGRINVNARG
jgi:hypothetical protein